MQALAPYHTTMTEDDMTEYRHGSAYDRGSADSYYRRRRDPHYFKGATYQSERVTDLTPEQVEEYHRGYDDNERLGDHKDWY